MHEMLRYPVSIFFLYFVFCFNVVGNLTFVTFYSRNHQFRIKGVSMSTFSEEEVAALGKVGNDAFNKIYLARLNPREYTLPNGTDENKLKEFIKQKYIDKRWHQDTGSGISSTSHHSFTAFDDNNTSVSSPATSSPTPDGNRISINLKKQGVSV